MLTSQVNKNGLGTSAKAVQVAGPCAETVHIANALSAAFREAYRHVT